MVRYKIKQKYCVLIFTLELSTNWILQTNSLMNKAATP